MSQQPLNILIVEDEAPIALAISKALERRGHKVTVANNGEDALQVEHPDVLVSDLELSGMDGLELFERLRRRGHSVRGVFVTGMPTFEACRQAMHLGASEFLSKPFRLAELVRAVEGEQEDQVSELPKESRRRESQGAKSWSREYIATARSVDVAPRDLCAYALRCGIGPATRSRIATALAEIVENSLRHGYFGGPGMVRINAWIEARELHIEIQDDGVGFDPQSIATQTEGFMGGLARAAALAESFDIDAYHDEGTTVCMSFAAYRVHFDEESHVDLSELDYLTPETTRRVLRALENKQAGELFHLSPALAVTIGRLLSSPTKDPKADHALWS